MLKQNEIVNRFSIMFNKESLLCRAYNDKVT